MRFSETNEPDSKRHLRRHSSKTSTRTQTIGTMDLGRRNESAIKAKKRLVSFNKTVRRITVRKYAEEEEDRVWYTRKELKRLKGKAMKTLQLMETQKWKADSESFCTRGLEKMTREGLEMKQRRRERALTVVLCEQEFQKEIGIPDPELIASLYSEAAQSSQRIARSFGLRDEANVDKRRRSFHTQRSLSFEKKSVSSDDKRGPSTESNCRGGDIYARQRTIRL